MRRPLRVMRVIARMDVGGPAVQVHHRLAIEHGYRSALQLIEGGLTQGGRI